MLSGKKIAVLMGGPGSEREVSLASGNAVLKALLGLGLDAVGVDVTTTQIDLPEGTDLAFNVIHGTFGEDGQLQDAMEKLGVPYTGAGSVSSKLAIHKSLAKEKFLAAGVPTARSETVTLSPGVIPDLTIKAPLVIKPPLEGSSVGIQIVKSQHEVLGALLKAAEKYSEVLIEEFIEGKELTVGIPFPIGDQTPTCNVDIMKIPKFVPTTIALFIGPGTNAIDRMSMPDVNKFPVISDQLTPVFVV